MSWKPLANEWANVKFRSGKVVDITQQASASSSTQSTLLREFFCIVGHLLRLVGKAKGQELGEGISLPLRLRRLKPVHLQEVPGSLSYKSSSDRPTTSSHSLSK